MGYVIVGGICLLVGAFLGIMIMALMVSIKNVEISMEGLENDSRKHCSSKE